MPRPKGAHRQAIRLIRLLKRLQGRFEGMRFADIQEELDISRSQLRRDLLALEEAGTRLEVEQEHGRYGHARVRLLDSDTTRIPVTRSERYTLLAARGFFDIFRGSQLHRDIESLFEKVLETMPSRTRRDTRSLAKKIIFRPTGGTKTYNDADTKDIVNTLLSGVLMERLVEFTYRQRSGRKTSGTFAPYAIVIHRNGLYVIAQRNTNADGNPITQEPGIFAVERFTQAHWIRRSSFNYPEDLDIESYFDGAFGLISGKKTHHVVIELSKTVQADARTRRWHRTQITTPLPGGRTRIEFDVTSLREVVSWVLEWGPSACVVAPLQLRERVVAALVASLTAYEDYP